MINANAQHCCYPHLSTEGHTQKGTVFTLLTKWFVTCLATSSPYGTDLKVI